MSGIGAALAALRFGRLPAFRAASFLAIFAITGAVRAEVVEAAPVAPIEVPFPPGESPRETQVVLQVVVGADGDVESAVEVSRLPRDASDALVTAAIDAVKKAKFVPSSRDGHLIRSRIEYVVALHPPANATAVAEPAAAVPPAASAVPAAPPANPAASAPSAAVPATPPGAAPAPAATQTTVEVHGFPASSPRGLGDVRVDRETLTASPRQQTSEMLSAAPGFFVDHQDGEGLGNDVYLRGFDLDSGSGIEMKIGEIPLNIPLHIRGQGYADVNFIIPEVVRSIRVLEGPYDPRQGDAAIVGSALFDLGVPERGYQLKTTYGSFNQARVVGIVAPDGANEETFAAFALRETQGFGQDRASKSASVNGQYSVDLTDKDHVRVLATAYASSADLPGVVRKDDVEAGRIGYYDAYPYYNSFLPTNCRSTSCAQPAQGVSAARVILGAELDHATGGGAHFEIAPWTMWTKFSSRQNYTGNLVSSNLQPELTSLGDLWQLTNLETAWGATARFHSPVMHFGHAVELAVEPGVSLRAGRTDQSKDLVNPTNLYPWDYRANYGLNTVDIAGYVDLDVHLWKALRIAGGVRADLLDVSISNNLAGVKPPLVPGALQGSSLNITAVAPGPRVTVAFDRLPALTPVFSAGEGFRSLDAGSLTLCNAPTVQLTGVPSSSVLPCSPRSPYSQVTSLEAGIRSALLKGSLVTTLTAFQTNVANELVFEVEDGGLTTERASTRRGLVGSVLTRPTNWLLASSALSLQTATFDTLVAGSSHYVPNIPAFLWRVDVNAHGELMQIRGAPLTGRVGVGYTLLGGRHVNDLIIAPTDNVVNALASLRYRFVELGVDVYNLLGLEYPDEEAYFVSNWSFKPGQNRASPGVHIIPAPPRTALATLSLYF
ncbi:MAG TPA: TonB-dependent receptor plug domain-containing protein [Polyangiaceae bacterium]|nr:TonB-dependent receptor plug domain-containing protein [Polyangiaceae bacterium]